MIHRKDLRKYRSSLIDILSDSEQKVLLVNVLFGVASRNCAGNGICKLAAPIVQDKSFENACGCKKAFALIALDPTGKITFHFIKKSISEKTRKIQFADRQFRMSEPLEFSTSIWSMDATIQIKAGNYAVEESEKHLSVIFIKGG